MRWEEQHKKDLIQTEESKFINPFNEETCDVCHGSGVSGDGTCSSCNGKGII